MLQRAQPKRHRRWPVDQRREDDHEQLVWHKEPSILRMRTTYIFEIGTT
jgi:hypothetical protein